jgi:hypothetical protein
MRSAAAALAALCVSAAAASGLDLPDCDGLTA